MENSLSLVEETQDPFLKFAESLEHLPLAIDRFWELCTFFGLCILLLSFLVLIFGIALVVIGRTLRGLSW